VKRCALDDAEDERRETVAVSRGVACDCTNERHVLVFYAAAEPVCQQLFDGDARELL
jgi:hypothetical protein